VGALFAAQCATRARRHITPPHVHVLHVSRVAARQCDPLWWCSKERITVDEMSGADEKIRAVLELVAMDTAGACEQARGLGNDVNDACYVALERRLLPLLLAGQHLREYPYHENAVAWDAALAAAQGQPEKESGR